MLRLSLRLVLISSLLFSLIGCGGGDDPTQVVVTVSSSVASYDRVQVLVLLGAETENDFLVSDGRSVATPFSFTVAPTRDPSLPRTIRVIGDVGGALNVGEARDVRFEDGETTFVTIALLGEVEPPMDGGVDASDDVSPDVPEDVSECTPGAIECGDETTLSTCEDGTLVSTDCESLTGEENGATAVCRRGECFLSCDEGRQDCNGDLGSGGDGCEHEGTSCATDGVDFLFMVDNSNSMQEEQANLARELNRMVAVLASGDLDADGEEDFEPISSIRLGVINADMGTGGFVIETCTESNFGDDGVLRTRGNTARPGCMGTYPKFLDFTAGSTSIDAFAQDATCVAAMGINGCGFEQPLEAILKALTPGTSEIRFGSGTVGHADGANAGFLRPSALLAIVALTDEDDCSARDPDLYNRSSVRFPGDLNLRCFSHPEALHPIERFVDGLLAVRAAPNLVFANIVGVPPELVSGGVEADYDAILADPAMQERIDPGVPTRLVPSCNRPGTGLAFPPVRMLRVGQELDARGVETTVQSICQDNFSGALNGVLRAIAARAG